MENTILRLLIAIALLICGIAGLIIKISDLQQKLKVSDASNREIYKGYKEVRQQNEALIDDNLKLKSKLSGYEISEKMRADKVVQGVPLRKIKKVIVEGQLFKRATTADYKKAIIKDYKAGADVHDIATKYNLKANTVFKAIARRKAKGDI
jgi:uncharacterized protein (DUF433 family)